MEKPHFALERSCARAGQLAELDLFDPAPPPSLRYVSSVKNTNHPGTRFFSFLFCFCFASFCFSDPPLQVNMEYKGKVLTSGVNFHK